MNRKLCILFIWVLAFLVLIKSTNSMAKPQINGLKVSFINIGQGDSALIQNSDGFDILIDGGKVSAGPTVVAYLRDQGIDTLEIMVASHADSDHIGGLIGVLEATDISVTSVLYNGYPGDTQTWNDFVIAVSNKGLYLTSAQFPEELNWGPNTVYILNPIAGLINPETNEASLVFLLDDVDVEFLFTGDIDSTIESEIIARGTPVIADILKVAHHGSNYSTSSNFLNAVQPFDSIISVGPNSYGHPGNETLARLAAYGSSIWRTDACGTIIVTTSDGVNYEVIPSPDCHLVFLPVVLLSYPTSTPTQTPTPTEPPVNTGNVVITIIFYDGTGQQEPDEYVEIRNDDSRLIQLNGWTLRDIADHVFTFPTYVMTPGQVCRIYTNEYHPEWCGFNYSSGSAIWNNTEDCAYLRDAGFTLIDEYCYP